VFLGKQISLKKLAVRINRVENEFWEPKLRCYGSFQYFDRKG